ncbi:FUSC family protein [Virgibacillus sp. NKC19-16]|uniref:FUSC family protein n=1 Tax=Virgibacillus salidurans TaxID=2831673 RepID=UPI001F36C846|nr:FUSC family protein [Virgibacillus sp. NKC19-16]UJL46798.1 FUSC family protein [Virgibacillus sp. NKC19-16]
MSKQVKYAESNSNQLYSFWVTIKQAFEIKKNPLPWSKAISAGFCMALPVLIGLLFGNLQNGLYAGIGGFTFLYMFNEPYAQRAKKLFSVMVGLSVAVGLGTLLAPYPYAIAVTVGLIGAIVTFIFGALKIPGPAAVFFVLVFSMTSAMEIDPSLAASRAGLVLLGGALSWVVAMSGWFLNPRGPEINAMKRVYGQLALLIDAIGTENFSTERQNTLQKLKDAENVLMSGYISWDRSPLYKQLYLLYGQANRIFSEVIEFYASSNKKLPQQVGDSVRRITNSIGKKASIDINLEEPDEMIYRLVRNIKGVQDIINQSNGSMERDVHISKPRVNTVLSGNLHKNSIVFLSAIRYGVILMIAALVAFSFEFDRSYWIPLSCAAVMLGSTIMTTFHRAIQRTVGTIIGILLASMLLSTHPDGYLIVIIILILTFMTELFIPRNYAIALFFITPNAIFMAENTTQIYNVSYFATARITDIFIGCAIGLAGTFIIGRRSASSRLPHLLSKTIRSQIQFMLLLFSEQRSDADIEKSSEMLKMRTNLTNLSVVYTTALGEIPRDKDALGKLWPVIFSIEQLGYLLDDASKKSDRPTLQDAELAQLLFVFEMMAKAAKQKKSPITRYVPKIKGFPHIEKEIADLQEALQVKDRVPVV